MQIHTSTQSCASQRMLNYLYIKPDLTTINNPQSNSLVERVHQLIFNMLVAKYLYNKVFDCIYLWGETIASIAWAIRASYHRTTGASPG